MTTKFPAVIYCRVSSQKQVNEGHGIESQEKRCIDYANSKDYKVVKVFRETAVSGGLFNRPAMTELLVLLDEHKKLCPLEKVVIIFDDLKRFARDVVVHYQLKTEITSRNGIIECPNFKFENSPAGKFVETMLAATGELERNQNREQVIQKQKARLELGYWTFCNPPGLKFIEHPLHGKLLTRREPFSSIFKEAIESYDQNILNTYDEVRDFVREKYKSHGINIPFGRNGAIKMLSNPLYCGDIEYFKWGVKKRKGHHDCFISRETFERVQLKMLSKAKTKARKDYSLDFPLRGFMICSRCGNFVTGSWNSGNGGKYANYWCRTSGCLLKYKALNRDIVEERFKNLLNSSKPKSGVLRLTSEIMTRCWENKSKEHELFCSSKNVELSELETRIAHLVSLAEKTSKQEVRIVYEDKISDLLKRKSIVKQQNNNNLFHEKNLGTASDKVFNVLENPLVLWESNLIGDRRTLLHMYFGNKLVYDKKDGFGTVEYSDGYSIIKSLETSKTSMVEMEGVEPSS